MLRTKKDVERHVTDVISKINSENEQKLRGYTFARLYFQVKDYDNTNKYLKEFLSVREHHAPAYKLLGQVQEIENNFECALQSYKRSLEIEAHQPDIVLKICEIYCQLPVDHDTAKYWADRAEQLFPHNEIVFKLREYLVSAEGEPDHKELEILIAKELAAQPKNVNLRIKLLRLYLDTERLKEAFEHATMIESKKLFPLSVDWYYLLCDIFEAYQEEYATDLDSEFYIHYLSALDQLILLMMTEPYATGAQLGKCYDMNDSAVVLLTFDQILKKASERNTQTSSWIFFINHMKGQLYFHMTSLLLKRCKKDQGNLKESFLFCAGLALVCYTFKPINLLQESWFMQMSENQKTFASYFQQGTLRTSFIGHIIRDFCKEDKNKWLHKMKTDVCVPQVKERLYSCIFTSVVQKDRLLSSYFILDTTFENCSLKFPSDSLLEFDKTAYKLCPDSLHHLVWLELHNQAIANYRPEFTENICDVFKNLQYSNNNLSRGSCESLCVLDIEAFLCASVYQAQTFLEKKKEYYGQKCKISLLSYPPGISDLMCTKQQASWWKAAHGLYSCSIKEKLGEHRRELQHGLEVIRGVGNHGMEVQLVVHLAKMFAKKADHLKKDLKGKEKKILPSNIAALQNRAVHYWSIALNLLEKLASHQNPKETKDRMFLGCNKTLSNKDIKELQDNGKLYLALQMMETDKLDGAAELLSKLSTPYGSFYLAVVLKKLANQEEKVSKHRTLLLDKAKNSILDTMDRIKDDQSHPLNKEIYMVLEDIENESANNHSYSNGNEEVDVGGASPELSNSLYLTPEFTSSFRVHSTPQLSTFQKKIFRNSAVDEIPRHFEPSPERLDAQIRSLRQNQDEVVKTVLDQQKTSMELNKNLVEALKQNTVVLEQLRKSMEDLKLTMLKYPTKYTGRKTSLPKSQNIEAEYCNDYERSNFLDYYPEETEEEYQASGYSYNPHLVHDAASLNYVMSPVIPPAPPSALSHYGYQYPPHAVLPAQQVADRSYYPPGQGLPFSEGQQLPQFHFHVASTPIGKVPPPVMGNVTSLPPTVTLPPPPLPPSSNLPPPQPQSSASLQSQPIIQQSNVSLPMPNPWPKSVEGPHAFQIPLPSGAVPPVQNSIVTSAPSELKNLLKSQVASPVSFPQIQQPAFSSASETTTSTSIFAGMSMMTPPVSKTERSRGDSETIYSPDIDGHDLEREVMGDFKPLIPLPAEVVVETGEENEKVLFEDRAKLYRFIDQEWKERGIGTLKILHHEDSARVRLLMRRDQVLKVCANHYITSNMDIQPLKASDRAWTWVAQDFADEELRPEQFCVRFKTAELANNFKIAFNKGLSIVKENNSSRSVTPLKPPKGVIQPSPPKPFGVLFLNKPGSWSCPTCYVNNAADKLLCIACETAKPGSSNVISVPSHTPPANASQFSFGVTVPHKLESKSPFETPNSSKTLFGGFSFTTPPVINDSETSDIKEREILVVSTKSKGGANVTKLNPNSGSPFSGFSFKTSDVFTPATSSLTVNLANDSRNVTLLDKGFNVPQVSSSSAPIVTSHVTSPTANKTSLKNLQSMVQNIKPAFTFDQKSGESTSTLVNTSVNTSKLSTGEPEEFIPTAEFKPVVPLPALVDLKTGEEGGKILFEQRAKLFRYDSSTKEWKERGIGELKILHMEDTDKYRILMRRDIVLKTCANHNILPEMTLKALANSDKAWVWFAQDFSEGSLIKEQFAAKFKNTEIAQLFKQVFERCQAALKSLTKDSKIPPVNNPCSGNVSQLEQLLNPATIINKSTDLPKTETLDKTPAQKPLSELFKKDVESWECGACYIVNGNCYNKCVACETPKPGALTSSSSAAKPTATFQFGAASNFAFNSPKTEEGFVFGVKQPSQTSTSSFASSSLFVSNTATKNTNNIFSNSPKQNSNATAQSIFGNISYPKFDFATLASSQKNMSEPVEFRFGSPQKYEFNFSGVRSHSPTKGPKSPRSPETPDVDEDDEGDSFDADSIYFQPVIPLPPKVETVTGEEDELILFCHRAKLFRFHGGEWKERGLGDIKILLDEKSNRLRILMRRDQVLKVCLNHALTADIKFEWRGDKSLTWAATDFSENDPSPELLAVRFKTTELAKDFKNVIDKAFIKESDSTSDAKASRAPVSFSFKSDPPKESNFNSGSLTSLYGTTSTPVKSLFGNSNLKDEKSSSLESPFSFGLSKTPVSSSFFDQPSNLKLESSKTSVQNWLSDTASHTATEIDSDIIIAFEAVATPEQIEKAEKLLLPKNFYLYELKEPCRGCYGCDDIIVPPKVDSGKIQSEEIATSDDKIPQRDSVEEEGTIFNTSNLCSFTDLASTSSFKGLVKSVSKSPSTTVFAGAGTPLFANLNSSADESNVDLEQEPNVHFTPLVPLPDLVKLETGEENEEEIFVNRAKLFRFDSSLKQWKERGIGNIKILQHKDKVKFRIILRREQVYSIACNHFITEDMDPSPLSTSQNAVCWSAIDFSDGKAEPWQFTVRFKHKEECTSFEKTFKECILKLKDGEEAIQASAEVEDDSKSKDSNCDEIDDEDEPIFDKRVSLDIFNDEIGMFHNQGMGSLRISYDDCVFGYRLKMIGDKGNLICDHIIAVQTCLITDSKKKQAKWSALDLSVNPIKRRQFRTSFNSNAAYMEFKKTFEDGKEIAMNSEIIECSE